MAQVHREYACLENEASNSATDFTNEARGLVVSLAKLGVEQYIR